MRRVTASILLHPWRAALAAGLFASTFNVLLVQSLLIASVIGVVWFVVVGFAVTRVRQRGEMTVEPGPINVSRTIAAGWSIGVGIIMTIALAISLPSIIRDRYGNELRSYYAKLKAGEVQKAYDSLCTGSRANVSLVEFDERLERQLEEIGAIKSYNPLRGEATVGHVVVEGERRTVESLVPVKREDGSWRPCPDDLPLGKLVPRH